MIFRPVVGRAAKDKDTEDLLAWNGPDSSITSVESFRREFMRSTYYRADFVESGSTFTRSES